MFRDLGRDVPDLEKLNARKVWDDFSGADMTGRPGDHTMEVDGGSTVLYLARTPRVPLFVLVLVGLEAKGLLDFQGRRGITSIVRWNLRPVIFGVEFFVPFHHARRKSVSQVLFRRGVI